MRYVAVLFGLIAMLAFVGCGDDDPVSSVSQEGINAPAGKLTISGAKAGGYPGERALLRMNQAGTAAFNTHDIDRTVALRTDDVITDYVPQPPPMEGKESAAAFYSTLFTSPDPDTPPAIHIDVLRRLSAGKIIVGETLITGIHKVEWAGVPPTGNPFSLPHLTIYEYEGDKIKRENIYMDNVTLFTQMGVMEAGELPPLVPSFELLDPVPTGLSPIEAARELIPTFNTHDLPLYMQRVHRDAEIFFGPIGVPMDRNAYAALNELYLLGFPDLTGEDTRILDLGDGWVLTETFWSGNHDGPYFGIPATGLPSTVRTASLARYDADGLLTDFRFYYDGLTILMNIGAVPAP